MGRRHVRVLAALSDRFELVGAYDLSETIEVPPSVPRLASEAEAIGCAEAVIVATPIEVHADSVARALAAGRHVLVEKPMCESAARAEALLAASTRGGARLFVGHSERFNPVVRALSSVLRGERIHAIAFNRVGPARLIPQGVLLNLGVHDLDLACYLSGGDIALRSALGGGGDGASQDTAHVLFETSRGAVGHIHVDRTQPSRNRTITAVTSRWVYEGDLLAGRLRRVSRSGGVATDVPLPAEEPLVAQARAFAEAVQGLPLRELATGADGARAVRLAELAAARCSAANAEKLSLSQSP
jgi:predicted dehydrogenase